MKKPRNFYDTGGYIRLRGARGVKTTGAKFCVDGLHMLGLYAGEAKICLDTRTPDATEKKQTQVGQKHEIYRAEEVTVLDKT